MKEIILSRIKEKIKKRGKIKMFEATKTFIEKLEEKNLKYEFYPCDENKSYAYEGLGLNLSTNNITSVNIEVFFSADGFDVGIRCFELCKTSEEKFATTLELINKINKQYFYVKFCIDEEYNIIAAADTNIKPEDIDFGSRLIDFVSDFMSVLDEVYPELMKEIWK